MNDIPFKYYIAHIIVLILSTIVDMAFIMLAWSMGYTLVFGICIFLGIFLLLPALALLVGWIYVVVDTRKRENRQEKILLTWAIIVALAIPLTMPICEIQNNQARYFYDLPDNSTMTIWRERIIFEKYTSCFPPRTNYIQLPSGAKFRDNWAMVIDTAGRAAVYVIDDVDEIKQVAPKYPLVATYDDRDSFRTDFPVETWMLHCEYTYWPDAFSTCGEYQLLMIANDSVTHIHGYFPFREYARYEQSEPFTEPLDSLDHFFYY